MIPRRPFPVKHALCKVALFCTGLLLFCTLFLGGASVWVGLSHRHEEGFWAPLLAGLLFMALTLWLYLRLFLALKRAMRHSDILNP